MAHGLTALLLDYWNNNEPNSGNNFGIPTWSWQTQAVAGLDALHAFVVQT